MKLAQRFLETLGPPPWQVSAAGLLREVTPKTLASLTKLMKQADEQRQGAHAILPRDGTTVRHLAIHTPRDAKASILPVPPSIVVMAKELTMIWVLNDPVPAPMAQAISADLAKAVKGRPAVGEGVPLPGSILYAVSGFRLTSKFPVQMLQPLKDAYRLVDGRICRPAKQPARAAIDPATLAVPLGVAQDGGQVTWQPGQQSNGFMLILGASGSGKTETLKVVGSAIHKAGIPLLIFDFHGDVRLPGVQDVLLSSGTDSTRGLNPMELDGACARESGLYDQRGALREMIMRASPMLGHRQSNALREAIETVCLHAGILDNDPATWSRTPPTFADLMREIEDEGLKAGVSELFGHPIFQRNEHLRIDALLARSTRLDLSKLSDGVRFIATESLLQRLFRFLRMRGPIPTNPSDDKDRFRLFVMIDEAKILSMGGNGGRNILSDLFTEARKFGLGMILASQMAEHFSSEVRANAATWLVLKPQEMSEAKRNAPNVGVEPEKLMALNGRGDGFYRDRSAEGARRIQVRALSI
jgi:hypothetical protein